jgi:hypothetical protein
MLRRVSIAGEDGRGDTLPSDFELEGVNGLLMPFFLPFCFDRKDDRDATLVGVLDTETGVREGVPGPYKSQRNFY